MATGTTENDDHPLNELNDYVDDLIKNAFKQEPVTIEDQCQEISVTNQIEQNIEPEQEQIELSDEIDGCLEL